MYNVINYTDRRTGKKGFAIEIIQGNNVLETILADSGDPFKTASAAVRYVEHNYPDVPAYW